MPVLRRGGADERTGMRNVRPTDATHAGRGAWWAAAREDDVRLRRSRHSRAAAACGCGAAGRPATASGTTPARLSTAAARLPPATGAEPLRSAAGAEPLRPAAAAGQPL